MVMVGVDRTPRRSRFSANSHIVDRRVQAYKKSSRNGLRPESTTRPLGRSPALPPDIHGKSKQSSATQGIRAVLLPVARIGSSYTCRRQEAVPPSIELVPWMAPPTPLLAVFSPNRLQACRSEDFLISGCFSFFEFWLVLRRSPRVGKHPGVREITDLRDKQEIIPPKPSGLGPMITILIQPYDRCAVSISVTCLISPNARLDQPQTNDMHWCSGHSWLRLQNGMRVSDEARRNDFNQITHNQLDRRRIPTTRQSSQRFAELDDQRARFNTQ